MGQQPVAELCVLVGMSHLEPERVAPLLKRERGHIVQQGGDGQPLELCLVKAESPTNPGSQIRHACVVIGHRCAHVVERIGE